MMSELGDPAVQTLPSISHNLNQTSAMKAVMGQTQPTINLTSPTAVSCHNYASTTVFHFILISNLMSSQRHVLLFY